MRSFLYRKSALILILIFLISVPVTASDNHYIVVMEDNQLIAANEFEGKESLKHQAEVSQKNFKDFASKTAGIEVVNDYWIKNAVKIKSNRNVEALEKHPDVERVIPNFQVSIRENEIGESSDELDTTYGIEHINATKVWEEYGEKGQSSRVAVLDTGVDPDHDDIDIKQENWKDFVRDEEEPKDYEKHGTHVSGTVSGGNSSGTSIGVSPETELMHGAVLDEFGSGSLDDIISGMEWAVENDADVISMSLGATGYGEDFIEPVQNAESLGTVVVAAIGNDGEGSSDSPGNVFDVLSVGAVDEEFDVTGFSSGEEIDTEEDWNSSETDDWPETYKVPSVTAPGVDTFSAVPGNNYSTKSGTSMATPHVSGGIALLQSLTVHHYSPGKLKESVQETAWKPDSWEVSSDERDVRYGRGILDISSAVDYMLNEIVVELESCREVRFDSFRITEDLGSVEDCITIDGDAEIDGNVSTLSGSSNSTGITVKSGEPEIRNLVMEDWGTDLLVEKGEPVVENNTVETVEILGNGSLNIVDLESEIIVNGQVMDIEAEDASISPGDKVELPNNKANVTEFIEINGKGQALINKSFDGPDQLNESNVGLYRYDGQWEEVENTDIYLEEEKIEAQLENFSTFVVLLDQSVFDIREVEGPEYRVPSQNLTLDVTVENTGEEEGVQEIKLEKENRVADSEALTLAQGEQETFTLESGLNETGNKTLEVITEDDSHEHSFEVLEQPKVDEVYPEDQILFNWTSRKVEFGAQVLFNESSIHRLFIDGDKVEEAEEILEEGSHSIEFEKELDEGNYTWYITSEGEKSGFTNSTEERELEIREEIDLYDVKPGNNSEIGYLEENKIGFEILTENPGNLTVRFQDDNFEYTHDGENDSYEEDLGQIEPGDHTWNITFESDLGNNFFRELQFAKKLPEAEFEKQDPENDTDFSYTERNIELDFEATIESGGNLSLKHKLGGEEPSEIESFDLNSGELNNLSQKIEEDFSIGENWWWLQAEMEENKTVESEPRVFTVEEPEINISGIGPENKNILAFDEREVIFEASKSSEIASNTTLVINEEIEGRWNKTGEDKYLNQSVELEPGEHIWYFNSSNELVDDKTEERKLEILPESNFEGEINSPEDGDIFSEEEDIDISIEAFTDLEGNLSLLIDGTTNEVFSLEEEDEFELTESLDEGFHELRLRFETAAGTDSETNGVVIEVEEQQDETSSSGGASGGLGGLSDDEETFEEEEEEEIQVTRDEDSLIIENIDLEKPDSKDIDADDSFPLRKIVLKTGSDVEEGSVNIDQTEIEHNEDIFFHRGWRVETEDDLSGVKEFRVSNDWLDENNLQANQISMFKLEDGGWTSLETDYIEQEGDHRYFSAETGSFSRFASGTESPIVQAGNLETGSCDTFRQHEITEGYNEYESCQEFEEKRQVLQLIEEKNRETSSEDAEKKLETAEKRLMEGDTEQASQFVDQAEKEERNSRVKSILVYLIAGLVTLLSITAIVYRLHRNGREQGLEKQLEDLRQNLMENGYQNGYSQKVYRKVQEANQLIQEERFDAAEQKLDEIHSTMEKSSENSMFA